MLRPIAFGSLALFACAAAAQEAPTGENPNAPVRMTPGEIAAYNADLAASDPLFIKCVRQEGPGSMVKRRVCRTNADWSQRAANATQEARDIIEKVNLHHSTHGQEPAGTVFPVTPN